MHSGHFTQPRQREFTCFPVVRKVSFTIILVFRYIPLCPSSFHFTPSPLHMDVTLYRNRVYSRKQDRKMELLITFDLEY